MRGDSTPWSTVLVCECGARCVAATAERAYAELAAHQGRAGCAPTAATALRMRAGRA